MSSTLPTILPYRQYGLPSQVKSKFAATPVLRVADGNNLIAPFDRDGWFATGDIGSLDASGLLTVFGRAHHVHFRRREYLPEEIERALLRFDSILDAVVCDPHSEYGHRPAHLCGRPNLSN